MSTLRADETIIQLLKKAAEEAPQAAAIQEADRQLTYAGLWGPLRNVQTDCAQRQALQAGGSP